MLYSNQLGSTEAEALPQFRRPVRAVQNESGLATASDDMDMRGSMIVRIDDHPQALKSKNGRHRT